MWDLPRPGLKPVSPELAGGFLTITPPGKPHIVIFESVFTESVGDEVNGLTCLFLFISVFSIHTY